MTGIPPITLIFGRVSLVAAMLYLILRLQGQRLRALGRIWGHLVVAALFHNSLTFVLLSWGEQHIDSALAGRPHAPFAYRSQPGEIGLLPQEHLSRVNQGHRT